MISEPGICPNCGSDAIEYSEIELDGECVWYPAKCQDCGHTYRECYELSFIGTEDQDDGTWHDSDLGYEEEEGEDYYDED